MSQGETFKSDNYDDGRTKQAFKDSADINKILFQAQAGDSIAHLVKHGAVYGDFTDIDDLMHAHNRLEKAKEIFQDLPSEIRKEFGQSPADFFNFVNNPDNHDKLRDLIPRLAEPGFQTPSVRRTGDNPGNLPPEPPAPESTTNAEPPPE